MTAPIYTNEQLLRLREAVSQRMSKKRFLHTEGVLRAAVRLGELLLPDECSALSAAALLHDVAKELDDNTLLALASLTQQNAENLPRAVLHSFAAVAVIERDFPEFDNAIIKNAVKNHTLGSPDMSIFDRIIFVADFIEQGRVYLPSCELREKLFRELELARNNDERIRALNAAVVFEIEATESHLLASGREIAEVSRLTKNAFSV